MSSVAIVSIWTVKGLSQRFCDFTLTVKYYKLLVRVLCSFIFYRFL